MGKSQIKPGPLTTGEIADFCHVTHRAVLKWVTAGKLKAYRTPGNHSRVRKEDFLSFLEKYRMPVPAELQTTIVPKKILIVDDDKGMVHSLQRALMMENKYVMEVAFDGFEAGAKYMAFRPDFVILDILMPGMDGYQVCAKIRQELGGRDVKILVISGSSDPQDIKKILDLGADAYLEKPFSNETLREKIKHMLE